MPVIINGQVIDLETQTLIPLTPPRAWAKAREGLERAKWPLRECIRVVRSAEPEMLVEAVRDCFVQKAPAAAVVACIHTLRQFTKNDAAWVFNLANAPADTRAALLQAWSFEPNGIGTAMTVLIEKREWKQSIEQVLSLVTNGSALGRLADDAVFVEAIEGASSFGPKVPLRFIELLILVSGPEPRGALRAWFEAAKTDRPVERKLLRMCASTGRRDLLPKRMPSVVPRDGSVVRPAFETLLDAMAAGASGTTKTLRGPASPKVIDEVEAAMNLTLPPEVKALWSLADGQKKPQDRFFGFLEFLGAKRSLEARKWMLGAVRWLREYDALWDDAGVYDEEILSDEWVTVAMQEHELIIVSAVTGRVFKVEQEAPPITLAHGTVAEWLGHEATMLLCGE